MSRAQSRTPPGVRKDASKFTQDFKTNTYLLKQYILDQKFPLKGGKMLRA